MNEQNPVNEHSKDQNLEASRHEAGDYLTTNAGVRISNTNDSLKAGDRGPTLLEDFHLQQKVAHFDRERIPERVVHARGSGAHGYFQVYEPLAEYTRAKFLQDPAVKTPVFVRFSTVVGFRGSADTVRDVRGFSVKFYTEEGNYDLVGNNIPVFFIQDGIKFPDLVHAIKPEPHNEMPQAAAAHDNFWDFISLMPESMHMIMWLFSDRTLPRSYRMMQGFGIHTFRFVNEQGKSRFVKFHWKPILGVHSLAFDEAQTLGGKDPDFHRRDLWEAIEAGNYPEFELGVQIVEAEDEHKFDFDLLDSTKLIPEEIVPVRPIGKMVLDRNPDNFFAETEQVAFQPSNVVPGIDFSDDPLLQSRLFSYADTQLHRLGSPNLTQIPINRPVCPFHNNQRDGFMQQEIYTSKVNYSPNSLGENRPMPASEAEGGFVHRAERVEGHKVRERSESFKDHFSQATLFWNSMSDVEKGHLVKAAHFELGKVMNKAVKERLLELFNQIDHEFTQRVAVGLGLPAPTQAVAPNHGKRSPALSIESFPKTTVKTRQVGVLVADGFNTSELMAMKQAITQAGAEAKIVSIAGGKVKGADGQEVDVERTFTTAASVMFDAVYIPGGKKSVERLKQQDEVIQFITEALKHYKAIAATGEGVDLLAMAAGEYVSLPTSQKGVFSEMGVVASRNASETEAVGKAFIEALVQHRYWTRTKKERVPA
jgi:catalase